MIYPPGTMYVGSTGRLLYIGLNERGKETLYQVGYGKCGLIFKKIVSYP